MSDPTTNEREIIDGLLAFLDANCRPGYRNLLTALVAERDELKQRAAELEVARVLTLSRAFQSEEALRHDRDRDLRERLVCAALTGLMAQPAHGSRESWANIAVSFADATLDAMRKGEA